LTTVGQTGTNLKIAPVSGSELTSVAIEGCLNNNPAKGSYPLDGSLVASTTGATATTTHAGITAQGTLTFGGNAAGLEDVFTVSKKG